MEPDKPRYEYRAWANAFPDLPQPDGEEWTEETYLVPLGLPSLSIKLRDGVLDIKEWKAGQDGPQLWQAAARLTFPIPAPTVDRELVTRLQISLPLSRERYGPDELVRDLLDARRNVVAVAVRKRRRIYDADGCRAETTAVEIGGQPFMTAAIEHESAAKVASTARKIGLDGFPNRSYPEVLDRLAPRFQEAG
jgi:hypothetical protein